MGVIDNKEQRSLDEIIAQSNLMTRNVLVRNF